MRTLIVLAMIAVTFEVASIKTAPPPDGHGMRGGPGTEDPALWICENMTLSGLTNVSATVAPGWRLVESWAEQHSSRKGAKAQRRKTGTPRAYGTF